MKFIVDELPNNPYECNFAEWVTFPPIMEETGAFSCELTNQKCNLYGNEKECYGLKVLINE